MEDVKGIYKLIGIAIISLLVPLYMAIYDHSDWNLFGWMFLTWVFIIGINFINSFDVFGDDWKNKIINKKFKR